MAGTPRRTRRTRVFTTLGATALTTGLIAVGPTIGAATTATATIGNRVWVDTNANGRRDPSEPGLANITLVLSTDTGTPLVRGTTTKGGWWGIANLKPGCYTLNITIPDGHTASPTGHESTINANGSTTKICVAAGDTQNQWDAGIVPPTGTPTPITGRIGNRVFKDTNFNGLKDHSDTGLAGIPVTLRNNAGTTIATGTTAEGGWYGFTDLPTDECYTVAVTIPDGYQTSPLGDPTKPGASTASPDGTTGPICLTADTANQDQWDTGLITSATGSGAPTITANIDLWYDNNNNTIRDAGDTGARGYEVQIIDASQKTAGAVSPLTGADGKATVSTPFAAWDQGETCNRVTGVETGFNLPNGGPGEILTRQPVRFDPAYYPIPDFPLGNQSLIDYPIWVCRQGATPPDGQAVVYVNPGENLTLPIAVGLDGPDPWLNAP